MAAARRDRDLHGRVGAAPSCWRRRPTWKTWKHRGKSRFGAKLEFSGRGRLTANKLRELYVSITKPRLAIGTANDQTHINNYYQSLAN